MVIYFGKYTSNRAEMPLFFSQNNGNLFECFIREYIKNNQKLKKEIEIYIRKNSKKILGGYVHGKNARRI